MRDHILLFVNGKQHRIDGADAFRTLSDFLRNVLCLVGTKIVCSEGDCGSCSVLCGTPANYGSSVAAQEGVEITHTSGATFRYAAIDSCIRFVYQLDGCNIVTVEGLTDNQSRCGKLTGVQQAMIDCHGSQCGFCTPGFVMAMTGILERREEPNEDQWRHGLTGNLCRCTGYSPIVEAGLNCDAASTPFMNECFDSSTMIDAMGESKTDEIKIESGSQIVYSPTTIDQAIGFLIEHPEAKIVAGATDVGVQFNKGHCKAAVWMDLNRIESLRHTTTIDRVVVAGACATWADIETGFKLDLPQFDEIVSVFGSPQIRNVGTIGGNIINASPIADSLPLLFVCEAKLQLQGANGSREVNINDFYQGYKKFDLQFSELLTQVQIPLPEKDEELRLYKISRRKDLDISSFTAAIKMKLAGDKIESASIAYGAVGPVVLRLPKTESFLTGKELSHETMTAAGELAVSEITPITDVRGGDEYRFQLAKNVLLKFLHEVRPEGALA